MKLDREPSQKIDQSKADPVKEDWFEPEPEPVTHPASPARSAPTISEPVPIRPVDTLPSTFPFCATGTPVEDAADDLVAALSDALITRAGDEFEANWSIDDPLSRVEELLEETRSAYGDAIGNRVEADAWSATVDAAQELADRLSEEDDLI